MKNGHAKLMFQYNFKISSICLIKQSKYYKINRTRGVKSMVEYQSRHSKFHYHPEVESIMTKVFFDPGINKWPRNKRGKHSIQLKSLFVNDIKFS